MHDFHVDADKLPIIDPPILERLFRGHLRTVDDHAVRLVPKRSRETLLHAELRKGLRQPVGAQKILVVHVAEVRGRGPVLRHILDVSGAFGEKTNHQPPPAAFSITITIFTVTAKINS